MKISELNQDILNGLFDIYREVTGSHEDRYPTMDDIAKQGRYITRSFEYRAGSRWWGHSKFRLDVEGPEDTIDVWFEPNMFGVYVEKKRKKEIDRAVEEFARRTKEYLKSFER